MGKPAEEPIGLLVTRTAKALSRAFDQTLAEAGGSLPQWLVLLSLKSQARGAQRELADAVGIEGATLTHHLNRMEAAGLVTRQRDPANRRVHKVELTEDGEAQFLDLLQHVVAFDQQLRDGLSERDLAAVRRVLERLRLNATTTPTKEEVEEVEEAAT